MRQFLVFMLFVSLLFIPHSSFSKQANTIDELAAMYNVEECADCHEEIHDEWKSSWHGQSLANSLVIRAWRTFIKRGLDKEEMLGRKDLKMICLPCHVPQIKDATDDVGKQIADLVVIAAEDENEAKRKAAKKELSKLNINCLSCHNLRALSGGNPKSGAIYGPKGTEDPEDPPHEEFETIKSDFMGTTDFCAQCHHGCPPGMPSSVCPTIYTSYMEDYVGKGGKETCQDCHMKQADLDEPKSHRFPGIYEVDFVKEGVSLTVNARPTTYMYPLENKIVPAVVVQVDLTNKAGHGIPRG
jgi:formate-dependent nitrite reductase cytochrome c552 subunit